MDRKYFLNCLELVNKDLVREKIQRAYNSIGSHVFFKFGRQIEEYLPNGRKTLTSEWTIWISNASWRITKHGEYTVGSGENLEVNIQTYLDKLLGKRFQSFRFLSQFLDVEFNFEDGYQISTFFNRIAEDQWLVFLPDKTEVIIDCSSEKAIESVQHLSEQIEVKDKYKELDFAFLGTEVNEILFGENELLKIICTEDFSIDLGLSAWRLGKNDQYQIGRKDYYFGSLEGQSKELEDKLLNLIEKKIKCMSVDSSGMDVKLEFEDGYVFEIFTHSKVEPWKIYSKNEIVLHAKLENVGN